MHAEGVAVGLAAGRIVFTLPADRAWGWKGRGSSGGPATSSSGGTDARRPRATGAETGGNRIAAAASAAGVAPHVVNGTHPKPTASEETRD